MVSKPRSVSILQFGSLLFLGLVAFGPTVQFEFVNWDDVAYVHHNELIRSWSPDNLAGIATQTVTRNYAPLTILSFLVDHTLWGMDPCGYHATNVLLHILNGMLVCVLLQRLTDNRFVAWTTAALFLVHPVQIESVAWVSSRKGLLCATFMLGACIVRMRQDVQARHDGWYIGLLIGALLSKALAVVLPPIVMTYDIFVRRMRFSDAVVRQVFPGFFAALLLLHTMGAQNTVLGGVRGHMELPLWQIMSVDVTILWQYIGMMFWPANLCVLYDPPTSGIWPQVVAGAVAWGVVAYGIGRVRQRWPLTVLGSAAFLLLLFPVLNFFRITTLMNDRYLYLPCIPVFAAAAWSVSAVARLARAASGDAGRWITALGQTAASVAAVTACLMVTTQHLPVWSNSMSLWTHANQQQPDIPVVRIQMALTLYDQGQVQEAVRVMSLALNETRPDAGDRQRMERAIQQWTSELEQHRTASARTADVR